jgi:ribosomal protein L37AE/L43A
MIARMIKKLLCGAYKMRSEHLCDNCERRLNQEDYDAYGSWSYKCPFCEFRYKHGSHMTPNEQVTKFNNPDNGELK